MMKKVAIILFCLMASMNGMAQTKKAITLNDVIPGGTNFRNLRPEYVYTAWWGDECVELTVDACSKVDKKTGAHSTLFGIDKINSILEKNKTGKIRNLLYAAFPYGKKTQVLVTNGKFYALVDWTKETVVKEMILPAGASAFEFCKESGCFSYVSSDNIFVVDNGGKSHQVTTDGSHDLVYGQSVHRNEFGIEKGTFWSPKGNLMAFYRMDQSMVPDYPQVDISTRIATLVPDKYPMAGCKSHVVSVGVFNPATDKTVYLKTGNGIDRYFTNISWSPDEKSVFVIELNRDQNHAQLVRYNASTGEKEAVLFDEKHEKYVEPCNPIVFLPWNNGQFIYQTRKDGYNHLYLYNADGKFVKQLTSGKFEVKEICGFNNATKEVFYVSNEISPLKQNAFALNVNTLKKRSLGDAEGIHTVALSESGKFITDKYNSAKVPFKADIINTATGKQRNIFTAAEPMKDYEMPEIKVGTIKAADGVTDLYYRIVLPVGFDESKKYPAVVYVYGGPHAHLVDDSRFYGARGWDLYMASKGYIVFSVDNRGSENRGLEFENCTFRNLGVEEMKDQLKGVDYLKSLPYVDANRLGVHGWSFGGFMTTSLMTTYPDVFKVGVAGGPVIDWKYYEVMYGERYMDTPEANPEGYKNTSLLNKAANLKGRLLLIYGGNDPTCVPQHTLSFIRACIDNGTHPDLFVYPGQEHNMRGLDRVHLHEHITRYFDDFLK